MKNLQTSIQGATSDNELRSIIDSIPVQNNGHRQQIYRILDDAFWYGDLVTFQQRKAFMLKKLMQYPELD